MKDFFDVLFSSQAIGLWVAAAIFIVTIVLIARRLIGLIVTLVLLFFALVSGVVIANNHIVREHFSKDKIALTESEREKGYEYASFKQQVIDAINEIKLSVCKVPDIKPAEPEKAAVVTEKLDTLIERLAYQEQQINNLLREMREYKAAHHIDEHNIKEHTADR